MSTQEFFIGHEGVAFDERAALSLLDGQRALLQELAVMFCEDAPRVLAELRSSVERSDPVEARRAVHNLKGLASTFFAKPTVELAQQYEDVVAAGDLDALANGGVESLAYSILSLTEELRGRGLVNQSTANQLAANSQVGHGPAVG